MRRSRLAAAALAALVALAGCVTGCGASPGPRGRPGQVHSGGLPAEPARPAAGHLRDHADRRQRAGDR